MTDDMANNWGVDYAVLSGKQPDKRFNDVDYLVKTTVPGFQLGYIAASGSLANGWAVDYANGGKHRDFLTMYAAGCYVASKGKLTGFASTDFDIHGNYSFPSDPPISYDDGPGEFFEYLREDIDNDCCLHIVPLPYHIPCKEVGEAEIANYENRCLRLLHHKILVAKIAGWQYKSLFMELILSGNGGELSNRYLRRLGKLLKAYDVSVIVDECLTGGRVGPGMTMTLNTPKEFLDCVKCITISKCTGCGLALMRVPKKPQFCNLKTREPSTHYPPGAANARWTEISENLQIIPERRQKVLAELTKRQPCNDIAEMFWGQGLIIFSSYFCSHVQQGLKSRLLPKLANIPLGVGEKTFAKDVSRSSICRKLMNHIEKWNWFHRYVSYGDGYMYEALEFILTTSCPEVTAPKLVSLLGDQAETLADKSLEWELATNHHWMLTNPKRNQRTFVEDRYKKICRKDPKSYAYYALNKIYHETNLLGRKRKGSSRTLTFKILRENLPDIGQDLEPSVAANKIPDVSQKKSRMGDAFCPLEETDATYFLI